MKSRNPLQFDVDLSDILISLDTPADRHELRLPNSDGVSVSGPGDGEAGSDDNDDDNEAEHTAAEDGDESRPAITLSVTPHKPTGAKPLIVELSQPTESERAAFARPGSFAVVTVAVAVDAAVAVADIAAARRDYDA